MFDYLERNGLEKEYGISILFNMVPSQDQMECDKIEDLKNGNGTKDSYG